jgi:hypothetical protein
MMLNLRSKPFQALKVHFIFAVLLAASSGIAAERAAKAAAASNSTADAIENIIAQQEKQRATVDKEAEAKAEKAAAEERMREAAKSAQRKAAAKASIEKAERFQTGSTKSPYDELAGPAAPEPAKPVKPAHRTAPTAAQTLPEPPKVTEVKSTEAFSNGAIGTETPSPSVESDDVIGKIIEGKMAVDKVNENKLNDHCCDLPNYSQDVSPSADKALAIRAKFEAKASKDEGVLQEPKAGENTLGSRSYMCGTRDGNYDVCIYDGEVTAGKFRFANKGPNKIVGSAAEGRMRDWMFNFEGKNRQDISFTVSDSVDGRESHSQESHMMLFPRKYLPNIRIEGAKQIVTLPTGETVTYDAATKVITDGVLTEKPLGQGPGSVSYNGNGLLLRIDGKQDPRHSRHGSMAIISKGGKTCRVPAKNLWPDQSDSSALHFKFSSDEAFNQFLKTKSGCPTLD